MVAVSTNEMYSVFLSCEISHQGLDGEILTFLNNYLTVELSYEESVYYF